jgi:hypothetical protein
VERILLSDILFDLQEYNKLYLNNLISNLQNKNQYSFLIFHFLQKSKNSDNKRKIQNYFYQNIKVQTVICLLSASASKLVIFRV